MSEEAMRRNGAGFLIEVEGPNGAGKSVMAEILARRLNGVGDDVSARMFKEPGGTAWADNIRALLSRDEDRQMGDRTRLMLYSAAKAEVYATDLIPHLNAGGIAVKDRGDVSTFTYQSTVGIGTVPVDYVAQVTRIASYGVNADLVIYLNASWAAVMERLEDRADGTKMGYVKSSEAVREICVAYDNTVDLLEGNWRSSRVERVDADQYINYVARDCLDAVAYHLGAKYGDAVGQEVRRRARLAFEGEPVYR